MSSLKNLVRRGTKEGLRLPIPSSTFYKRFGIQGTANLGGASTTTGKFSGGIIMNAGNGATSYAKASWNSSFSTITQSTGGGINFGLGVGFYAWGLFSLDTTLAVGQTIRIILGDDSSATTPANSTQNALTTRGFGFEIYNDSGTKKIRLFAHDGTTYSTSAGVSGYQFFYTYSMQFYVKNDSSGKVYLYFAESATENGLVPDMPVNPIITMSGGPTSATSAKRYVTANIIMNGTNNPANANADLIQLDETIFTVGI
jgi:hypothetical protein